MQDFIERRIAEPITLHGLAQQPDIRRGTLPGSSAT